MDLADPSRGGVGGENLGFDHVAEFTDFGLLAHPVDAEFPEDGTDNAALELGAHDPHLDDPGRNRLGVDADRGQILSTLLIAVVFQRPAASIKSKTRLARELLRGAAYAAEASGLVIANE